MVSQKIKGIVAVRRIDAYRYIVGLVTIRQCIVHTSDSDRLRGIPVCIGKGQCRQIDRALPRISRRNIKNNIGKRLCVQNHREGVSGTRLRSGGNATLFHNGEPGHIVVRIVDGYRLVSQKIKGIVAVRRIDAYRYIVGLVTIRQCIVHTSDSDRLRGIPVYIGKGQCRQIDRALPRISRRNIKKNIGKRLCVQNHREGVSGPRLRSGGNATLFHNGEPGHIVVRIVDGYRLVSQKIKGIVAVRRIDAYRYIVGLVTIRQCIVHTSDSDRLRGIPVYIGKGQCRQIDRALPGVSRRNFKNHVRNWLSVQNHREGVSGSRL